MLTAKISLAIAGMLSKAFAPGQSAEVPFRISHSFELLDGIAIGQADRIFIDRRTLAASATEDLDLAGALTNNLGEVVQFARIKAIMVRHISGVNNVVIGNAAATTFVGWFGAAAHTIAVPATGAVLLARNDAGGWGVGAGATDFLRIANGAAGTPVTYEIVIVGASA